MRADDMTEAEFRTDTVEAYEALSQRVNFLSSRVLEMEEKGREGAQVQKSLRLRVNISTSVKGVKTWEVTCDGQGYTMEEILHESDSIVAELERKYPAPNAD